MDYSKRKEHALADALLSFDLTEEIRKLKLEKQWETELRNAITLVKTPSLIIVLMIFNAGTTLAEHSTAGTISIQLLSGAVDFIIEDKTTHLKPSSLLTLAGGIAHSLHATEESALVLTVIPKTD